MSRADNKIIDERVKSALRNRKPRTVAEITEDAGIPDFDKADVRRSLGRLAKKGLAFQLTDTTWGPDPLPPPGLQLFQDGEV